MEIQLFENLRNKENPSEIETAIQNSRKAVEEAIKPLETDRFALQNALGRNVLNESQKMELLNIVETQIDHALKYLQTIEKDGNKAGYREYAIQHLDADLCKSNNLPQGTFEIGAYNGCEDDLLSTPIRSLTEVLKNKPDLAIEMVEKIISIIFSTWERCKNKSPMLAEDQGVKKIAEEIEEQIKSGETSMRNISILTHEIAKKTIEEQGLKTMSDCRGAKIHHLTYLFTEISLKLRLLRSYNEKEDGEQGRKIEEAFEKIFNK